MSNFVFFAGFTRFDARPPSETLPSPPATLPTPPSPCPWPLPPRSSGQMTLCGKPQQVLSPLALHAIRWCAALQFRNHPSTPTPPCQPSHGKHGGWCCSKHGGWCCRPRASQYTHTLPHGTLRTTASARPPPAPARTLGTCGAQCRLQALADAVTAAPRPRPHRPATRPHTPDATARLPGGSSSSAQQLGPGRPEATS